ncbi:MAG TPA: response regulator transcription factor [Gaiellaceae bacterium]|nr:response regulator transcription factor [Gaiellaceae bacterium]
MEQPIRVLLVEDNDVFRESLAFLLGAYEGIDVVGSVALGGEAARASAELQVDVAVVDYRLPDLDGAEAAREIRDLRPKTAVVFLSASVGADEADAARIAGAPLVGKDAGVDALVAVVRTAAGRSG